ILQGICRIKMAKIHQSSPYLKAKIERLDETSSNEVEAEALAMSLRDIAKQVIQLMPELPREAGSLIDSIQAPGALADLVKANLPNEAESVAKKQLKRLRAMQVGSAEYTVVRTYLDWILDIPWHHSTQDVMDIQAVRKILDEDHYGLEKVKKRILEYLAVRK